MNFEELRKQWKNESVPEQIELSLSLKQSSNAIDKVRKNMRIDFWAFVCLIFLSLVFLIALPYYIFLQNIIYTILWSFYLLFLVLSSYFLTKFYRFYRKSYDLSYNLKDSLWWFYYELRSFVDFYYTFSIVTLTMGLSSGLSLGYIGANILHVEGKSNLISDFMNTAEQYVGGYFLVGMVVFLIINMIGLHYAVQYMYGKHLRQLKATLDILRDD